MNWIKIRTEVTYVKPKVETLEANPIKESKVDQLTIKEIQERGKRKLNAIVFNLPEPNINIKSERDTLNQSEILN